ncbi:HIRAN domain-containing protein [Pseudorhizobium flavum]|uniref:HIRAN domain-containing protein n=1 Tax=Pseudorhizobium flavum TaxID=1335061 RepID=UPI0037704162
MAVVGESSFQDALIAICGRHTRHGHEGVYEALLVPEPTNRHDPNAIMVQVKGRLVGYLPREQAVRVGEQMRESGLRSARCMARIRGGWRTNQHDEGDYGVQLAIPNQGWIDFGVGGSPPAAVKRGAPPKVPKARPTSTANGPLAGKKVALMGAPEDGPLAIELAGAGAQIMAGVGKTTDYLVVVSEKPFSAGLRGSSAYTKAEVLIEQGAKLQVVSLEEIKALVTQAMQPGQDGK